MANTEGMPDEVLESLFGNQSRPRSAIQRRMDMPPGDRPAAKVIRPSGNNQRLQTVQEAKAEEGHEVQSDAPLIGSIVERGRKRRGRKKEDRADGTAAQQSVRHAETGFPALNVPLGTFIPRRNKSGSINTKHATASGNVQPCDMSPADTTAPTPASSNAGSSVNELKQVSSRDASNMLAAMSVEEIEERQQELMQALSPETVAFLRRRKQRQKTEVVQPPKVPGLAPKDQLKRDLDLSEKERIAQMLANVKSYDDLDAAFAAEMGDSDDTDKWDTEFSAACDLLRSSSARQQLWSVRIIAKQLQEDVESKNLCTIGSPRGREWPYPILLPVSLRCLLDTNRSRTNGYLLHTYALQSMYALLQLRVVREHVPDVSGAVSSSSTIYVRSFQEDAVPLPSPRDKYHPVSVFAVKGHEDAGYALSSSSTSAEKDGEAFAQDPAWTLLSRMKCIPRMAQLLKDGRSKSSLIPKEALVAIFGILAVIGQRAPGAAVAVAQHPSLLQDAVDIVFNSPDNRLDPSVGIALFVLLCTLARQSRIAASGLNIEPIILQVLSLQSQDYTEMQRWGLILYRTLLRYGLGLTIFPSVLAMASSSLALGLRDEQQLALQYVPILAAVLHCIYTVRQSSVSMTSISAEQSTILANSAMWLSQSRRTVVHLMSPTNEVLVEGNMPTHLILTFRASLLRYLRSYFSIIWVGTDTESCEGEFKVEDMTDAEEASSVQGLLSLIESSESKRAFDLILDQAFQVNLVERNEDTESLLLEAASCAFVEAITSLVLSIIVRRRDLFGSAKVLVDCLRDTILTRLRVKDRRALMEGHAPNSFDIIRQGWLNKAHTAIINFLWTATTLTADAHLLKAFSFCTLGRLGHGEEQLALLIVSQEQLFIPISSWHQGKSSPLASLMVQEFCRTPERMKQVDHSFKINNGLGLTADGTGPFSLQSLTSEFQNQDVQDFDYFLPLGRFWLWHMFTSVELASESSESGDDETIPVIRNALAIIDENDDGSVFNYGILFSNGAKFFHLCKLLLQRDTILFDEPIERRADRLFAQYTGVMAPDFGLCFITECHESSTKEMNYMKSSPQESPLLCQLSHSEECLRSMEAFTDNLCQAYIQGGAQSPLFTKCVRLFLAPAFPARIRCHVLLQLRGAHTLLSLEHEDIRSTLSKYVIGGLTSVDESPKDSSDFLDIVGTVFQSNKADLGFFSTMAAALLARNLAISMLPGQTGLSVAKDRISRLDEEFAHRIIAIVRSFLVSPGTATDLIECALIREHQRSYAELQEAFEDLQALASARG